MTQQMTESREIRLCKRCGFPRPARKTAILCTDCRAVLTPAERVLWAS